MEERMVCACGCGELTRIPRRPSRPKPTFVSGHQRRAQGILLAALSQGVPIDDDLLAAYTKRPRRYSPPITPDRRPGFCLCGCGESTDAMYATGHGYRFSDGLLRALRGETGIFTAPTDVVVALWRDRQAASPKASLRDERYARLRAAS